MTDTDGRGEAPLRVVFVCTANIARSPYAERRFAQLIDGRPDVVVASAGVPGLDGREMDAEMAAQLRARGGDPEGHRSRVLTTQVLDGADVVLTMEFAHLLRISQGWPDQAGKVFGLRRLADALGRVDAPSSGLDLLDQAHAVSVPEGMHWDVDDPHRRGKAAARACADVIDESLVVIAEALSRPTAP
jgi:protein-tyrosine phosphatase